MTVRSVRGRRRGSCRSPNPISASRRIFAVFVGYVSWRRLIRDRGRGSTREAGGACAAALVSAENTRTSARLIQRLDLGNGRTAASRVTAIVAAQSNNNCSASSLGSRRGAARIRLDHNPFHRPCSPPHTRRPASISRYRPGGEVCISECLHDTFKRYILKIARKKCRYFHRYFPQILFI